MGSGSSRQKSSKNEKFVPEYEVISRQNLSKNEKFVPEYEVISRQKSSVNKPKLLRIDDLLLRADNSQQRAPAYSQQRAPADSQQTPFKNYTPEFLKSAGNLRQELKLVKSIDENNPFIPDFSEMWLESVLKSIEMCLDNLNKIITNLDNTINDKKIKIDGKLDFIFRRFLAKKGIVGEDRSKQFSDKLENAKLFAVKLFKPVLEELRENPMLIAVKIGSPYKNHPEISTFKKMIVSSGKNLINIMDGNINEFANSTALVCGIADEFFNLENSMTFEEIRAEYEQMYEYGANLQRLSKANLTSKALEHINKKETIQYNMSDNIKFNPSTEIFRSPDLMSIIKFDEKDSKYLMILANLHNFMFDLQNSEEELKKYSLKKTNLIEQIDTYLKLSNKLSEIIARFEDNKFGGNDGPSYGSANETANYKIINYAANDMSKYLTFAAIICVVLIIVVFFFWKKQQAVVPKPAENIFGGFYKNIGFAQNPLLLKNN